MRFGWYASNPFYQLNILKGYKLYKQNRGKFSIMTVSNYNYPINWAMSLGKKNDLKLIGNKFNLKNKKIVWSWHVYNLRNNLLKIIKI